MGLDESMVVLDRKRSGTPYGTGIAWVFTQWVNVQQGGC
jgi:hypothetical protein